MVELQKLELVNFFNVKQATIPLSNQGLVIVRGDNGGGKTAMFIEGPFFALFGKSIRTNKAVGTTLKRRGAKGYVVRLSLTDGRNDYVISRSKGFARDQFPSGVTLTCNGKDITRGSDAATQAFFEQSVLGITPQTAKHSIFCSAEVASFSSMTDKQKKEILDDLLQFRVLETALVEVKSKLASAQKDVTAFRQEMAVHETKASGLSASLEEASENSKNWLAKHQADEADVKAKVNKAKEAWDRMLLQLQDAEERRKNLKAEEIKDLEKIYNQAVETQGILASELRQAELDEASERSNLNTKALSLKNNLMKMEAQKGQAECSHCGGPLGEAYLQACEKLREALEEAIEAINKVKLMSPALKEDLDKVTADVRELRKKTEDSAKVKRDLENEIQVLKTSAAQQNELVTNLVQRLKQVRAETNIFEQQAVKYETELERVLREKASCDRALVDRGGDLDDLRVLEVLFGIKGCRNHLLKLAIPQLNHKAEELRQILDTDMTVNFRLKDDAEAYAGTLEVEVKNPTGAEDYFWDSRGERRRIDILILLTLLELSRSRSANVINQSFFDEAFESLDTEGQESLFKLLGHITQKRSSMFVLSHTLEAFEGKADRQWTVENGKLIT